MTSNGGMSWAVGHGVTWVLLLATLAILKSIFDIQMRGCP